MQTRILLQPEATSERSALRPQDSPVNEGSASTPKPPLLEETVSPIARGEEAARAADSADIVDAGGMDVLCAMEKCPSPSMLQCMVVASPCESHKLGCSGLGDSAGLGVAQCISRSTYIYIYAVVFNIGALFFILCVQKCSSILGQDASACKTKKRVFPW